MERVKIGKRPAGNAVGYGKPPKAHQFKPGHSGNPKGRPKGSRNFATDVKAMLKASVKVSREGRARTISTQEASLMRLREQALSGNARALAQLLALAASFNNEQLAAATAALSADDEMLFKVFAARVGNGAVVSSVAPEQDVETAASKDDVEEHEDGG